VSGVEPTADACQIVVLGNFNSAIFSAGWLLANGLISVEESRDSRPQAIVPQLSIFEVSWLRIEVSSERFLATTGEVAQFERLRDVVSGMLAILSHTPVHSLGINRTFQVRLPSRRSWHRVGDTFAPKEAWPSNLVLPGMSDASVRSVRPDLWSGQVNVTLQPSATEKWGFFLAVNDHYNLKRIQSQPESREQFEDAQFIEDNKTPDASSDLLPLALEILAEEWNGSIERSWEVLEAIWASVAE
jgi:hypothetical protein